MLHTTLAFELFYFNLQRQSRVSIKWFAQLILARIAQWHETVLAVQRTTLATQLYVRRVPRFNGLCG